MAVQAIRSAGLNWARIRDALAEATQKPHQGAAGEIRFEYDLSNRRRVLLATFRQGEWRYGEPATELSF